MKTLMIAAFFLLLLSGCIGEAGGSARSEELIVNEDVGGIDVKENPVAVIITNKGEFRFELYEEEAPATVANFIELAESRFYDGLAFHRYEPGFVIQGGDPRGDGTGGSEKTIPLEIHKSLRHGKGAVGMARTQDPNSATSQFYVALDPAHFLDDGYAVFGKVSDGMDVVLNLRAGDKMEKVTIER